MTIAEPPLSKDALLDKLWGRLSERGDFPMLSHSVQATLAATHSDDYDFTALVQIILSDFALTQKVIRLANSAMYLAFGGNITTVSRALMVLGIEAVGHLVVGLKIVDHFERNAVDCIDAKLELNRTLLTGNIARQVTAHGDVRASEEAVVCALLGQIGKLLVMFYLETEWSQIRSAIQDGDVKESEACRAVLGASFDDIGQEAAARWRLPVSIRAAMSDAPESEHRDLASGDTSFPSSGFSGAPSGLPSGVTSSNPLEQSGHSGQLGQLSHLSQPGHPSYPSHAASEHHSAHSHVAWLRAITRFSGEVANILTNDQAIDKKQQEVQLSRLAQQYGEVLRTDSSDLLRISMDFSRADSANGLMKEITDLRASAEARTVAGPAPLARIEAGLEDLRSLPVENPLGQVLAMACESVLAGLGLNRTIVFVNNKRHGMFQARLGFGSTVTTLLPRLWFYEAFSPDVFHLAIANSVGIFIENAQDSKLTSRLPAWFRTELPDALGFVLLPVVAAGEPVALIYGDWCDPAHERKISPTEMSALNQLTRELGRFFHHAQVPQSVIP
jgi:HD-like signal output (HDOD) protein